MARSRDEVRREREERERQQREDKQSKVNGHAKPSLMIRTGDLFAEEYQPLKYVIDSILPHGTLITVTGPGNVGKTALAMMVAAYKANGVALNGWEVNQGHIVYASAENTIDFRHRYIAMRDNWPNFAEDHFHVLTSLSANGLTTHGDEIGDYCGHLGIDVSLIVVDTQAAWSPVAEEMNNPEQLAYARGLRRLCMTTGSPAVLVLSHPIKAPMKASECRPRGGAGFENETDANWTLWGNETLVEVNFTRLRVPPWKPWNIRIREISATSVTDIKGRPLRSVWAEPVPGEEVEELIKEGKAGKPMRKFKWQQALDVLDNMLIDFPQQATNPRTQPTDRTLTTIKALREGCRRAGIIGGEGEDERGQWRDLRSALLEKGYVRIDGDLCWRAINKREGPKAAV
jgi:hypothetical protein